jgi:hypothetical protein
MREPGDRTVFETDGHSILVVTLGETGFHTGRPRHAVWCQSCRRQLHESTTSPPWFVILHLEEESL